MTLGTAPNAATYSGIVSAMTMTIQMAANPMRRWKMLTLTDCDVAISAAEKWPAGSGTSCWAILNGEPCNNHFVAVQELMRDPEHTIP